ncbi:MAG: DUF4303 domain-containing protein [Thermoanaerobaculia bacterium]|nr:DUF4303 domain-containing protein [Thermoanaerobaculia bacterium]
MTEPSETVLTDAIVTATRHAVSDLFESHPGSYYYCALITSREAPPPFLSAWSREALAVASADTDHSEDLKWSYADSPFVDYGAQYFRKVRDLFALRPEMDYFAPPELWEKEYDLRLRCMENALRQLDSEGLFGVGEARHKIVVNAEVVPPDHTNTERAIRLNPPEALTEWLEEAAES